MLETCCLSEMLVCDCLHTAYVNCNVCDQNYSLRNILPILIPIQPKQMTSPRDPNIKNGDNNNQDMHMREQLLATQAQLNQVTTQFLANNNNLDPTLQKFLETQSQFLQRMTNQMINVISNSSQRDCDNNDIKDDIIDGTQAYKICGDIGHTYKEHMEKYCHSLVWTCSVISSLRFYPSFEVYVT